MSYLNFIEDIELEKLVKDVVNGLESIEGQNIHKNVIDPFSALFESMLHGITLEEWLKFESGRQYQKKLQNRIGTFHQKILSKVSGWKEPGDTLDLINHERKIVAEVKNKYNTLNAEGNISVYDKLETVLNKTSGYYGYTAYCVHIVPDPKQKRYNRPFTPSDNKIGMKKPEHEKIRSIDGGSFYELVTNEPRAIENLYKVLPIVIRKVRSSITIKPEDNAYFEQFFKKAFNL